MHTGLPAYVWNTYVFSVVIITEVRLRHSFTVFLSRLFSPTTTASFTSAPPSLYFVHLLHLCLTSNQATVFLWLSLPITYTNPLPLFILYRASTPQLRHYECFNLFLSFFHCLCFQSFSFFFPFFFILLTSAFLNFFFFFFSSSTNNLRLFCFCLFINFFQHPPLSLCGLAFL